MVGPDLSIFEGKDHAVTCAIGRPSGQSAQHLWPTRNANLRAQTQISPPQDGPLLGDHAQQPADVVDRCPQHRMQPITLEMASIHPMSALEMVDDGLIAWRRLTSFFSCSLILLALPQCTIRIRVRPRPVNQIEKGCRGLGRAGPHSECLLAAVAWSDLLVAVQGLGACDQSGCLAAYWQCPASAQIRRVSWPCRC